MIRLRTLGAVALERDGISLGGRNTQRRRLALLVLLACARRPMSRDRIIAQLWSERDAEHARHALAQLVYELRRDLGQGAITAHGDDLSIDATMVTSDIAELEEAMQQGATERAAALYGGPFLDGFFVGDAPEFERWAEERRNELATRYLHVLETLAIASADRGDVLAAADYRRRAAALDPLSTRQALALMQALALAGDRAAAIRHARLHAQLLRCELDAEPDPAVTELAARLSREAPPSGSGSIAPESSRQELLPHDALREHAPDITREPPATERPAASPPPFLEVQRGFTFDLRRIGQIVAVLLAVSATVLLQGHRVAGKGVAPRVVLLGEIASNDSILSLAIREAIRAELERTSDVIVMGDAAVANTLRLMELPPATRLTESIADDVALRGGTPLVVVGRAVALGDGMQLVARLVDAQHGTTLATVAATPLTVSQIVPAVARLAAELRDRASSSAVSASAPLPAVTTSSLEALRAYAMARAALARVDRQSAITYGEAAVAQDSDFALAHYLLGDLLWYVDQEHHAEVHLQRAYALSARLPLRERLLVLARYTQLVLDRPDSALTFWHELRAAYPAEALGYEGSVWADLAIGQYDDAAAAADSALHLDSTTAPQVRNRMSALLGLRDTAGALALARTAGARWPYLGQQALLAEYEGRGDRAGMQRVLDSIAPPWIDGQPNLDQAPTRQALLLSEGRLAEAQRYGELVVANMHAQFAIRSLLFQARGELAFEGSPGSARAFLHAAVTRLDSTDLSPPATSRLAELAAGIAAAAGDDSAIVRLRRIVLQRDAGRHLPSHQLALLTLDAADAFVHHEYGTAVGLLERTRPGRFFGRSSGTLALLEADALARLGDRVHADSLYRLTSTPGALREDGDVWMVLQPVAAQALAALDAPPIHGSSHAQR